MFWSTSQYSVGAMLTTAYIHARLVLSQRKEKNIPEQLYGTLLETVHLVKIHPFPKHTGHQTICWLRFFQGTADLEMIECLIKLQSDVRRTFPLSAPVWSWSQGNRRRTNPAAEKSNKTKGVFCLTWDKCRRHSWNRSSQISLWFRLIHAALRHREPEFLVPCLGQ